MAANSSVCVGIDTTRIYFLEDIAEIWGYDFDATEADKHDRDRLRKWFQRNFTSKGLRTFPTGGRVAVHGDHLSEWIRHNSLRQTE